MPETVYVIYSENGIVVGVYKNRTRAEACAYRYSQEEPGNVVVLERVLND